MNDPSDNDVYNFGLFLLDEELCIHGSSLSSFPSMPTFIRDWQCHSDNPYLEEQMHHDLAKEKHLT
jgi:hypothetical protein